MTTVVEFAMLSSCLLGVVEGTAVQFFGAVGYGLGPDFTSGSGWHYFFVTLTKAGVV